MPTPGSIYILLNPSMPGMLKVGKTTKTAMERASEVSGVTGVPTPFMVAFEAVVGDCDLAERRSHEALKKYRVTSDREFFSLPLKNALEIVSRIAAELPFSDIACVIKSRDPEKTFNRFCEACASGDLEAVRRLIKHVHNIGDDYGRAYKGAVNGDHVEVVEELLQHGADRWIIGNLIHEKDGESKLRQRKFPWYS